MLKRKEEYKRKLKETLKNYANKVKYLDKPLQHVSIASLEQYESSTTKKRGSIDFSPSQEHGLQKPPK